MDMVKTSHYDYRVTNRGGKGIIGIVNSPRNEIYHHHFQFLKEMK